MGKPIAVTAGAIVTRDYTLSTDADPTAGAIAFAAHTSSSTPPLTGAFQAGTFGAYDAATDKVTVTTPTMGTSATLAMTAGTVYHIWAELTVGSEVDVQHIDTIEAT